MRAFIERFFSMPFLMRVVCIVMFSTPLLAVSSVLSGSIAQSDSFAYEYGAARSLMELLLVIMATMPAFVGAIFMLMKRRVAVHLFAIGYIGATIGPFFLKVMRGSAQETAITVLVSLIIGAAVYAYLCFSIDVRQYFENRQQGIKGT